MGKITLIYPQMAGRAEPIRDALKIGHLAFEEINPTRDQWATHPLLPFGLVPAVVIDGQVLTQSNAILLYIGQKANLVPCCTKGYAKVVEILNVCEDLFGYFAPTWTLKGADLKAAREALLAFPGGRIHTFLKYINAKLEKSGTGFIVGKELSVADLKLSGSLGFLQSGYMDHIPKNVVDTYPAIVSYTKSVAAVIEAKKAAPKPTLVYFKFGGRAEAIRQVLKMGGIDYAERNVEFGDLTKGKEDGSLPLGAVPVMEIDGEVLTESNAILTYWGKKTGYYPDCALAAARAQEAMGASEDFIGYIVPTLFIAPDVQKVKREELLKTRVPQWLGGVVKLLALNKGTSGFLHEKLSVGDLKLCNVLKWIPSLDHFPKDLYTAYPTIAKYIENVDAAVTAAIGVSLVPAPAAEAPAAATPAASS